MSETKEMPSPQILEFDFIHGVTSSVGYASAVASQAPQTHLQEILRNLTSPSPIVAPHEASIELQLFNARTEFKRRISEVAMHLSDEWRLGLFKQIDSLLDVDEWDTDDIPVTADSFRTAIRLLIFLKPNRRPGMAVTPDGRLIFTWTLDSYRVTVTCNETDRIRWLVTRTYNGKKETAAGDCETARARAVLEPYNDHGLY